MRVHGWGGILALVLGCFLAGCIEKVPPSEANKEQSNSPMAQAPAGSDATANTAAPAPGAAGNTAPPMPTDGSGPSSPEPAQGSAAPAKSVSDLEAKLARSPNDPKVKSALAVAYAQQGEAIMMDASLPPRQKYPNALRLFRKALALNPKQPGAAEGREAIETIYKQMGMPIPP